MAQWRDLVGGFILAFGDIELISFRLWRDHVGLHPEPHNFKERTGRVLTELRRASEPDAVVVTALEEALRLADKRNTVAHHPMQVQVYMHSSTGEVMFEHAVTSETTGHYITDDDLKELRAEAEDIASRLYMRLGFPEPKHRAR